MTNAIAECLETKTTRTFNTQDWTGDEITVDYDEVSDGRIVFEYYGYQFVLEPLDNADGHPDHFKPGEGWRELHGNQWSDKLTTLFFIDEDGRNAEEAVIKAVRWIRKYV